MVFGVFTKKAKRIEKDLGISDPGSDDSWAVLYKNQSKSLSKSSGKLDCSARVPLLRTATTTVPAVSFEQDKETSANVKGSDLQDSTVTSKGKPQAFTSTPFTKNKKAPIFEVSSIISPIDITEEGHPLEAPPLDELTLQVNRKNPLKPSDETFNQLLNGGTKAAKNQVIIQGIQPVRSVANQADTTRQYGGGALRGRSVRTEKTPEDSWETAEEETCTAPSKNTGSSSCEKSKRLIEQRSTVINLPKPSSEKRTRKSTVDNVKSASTENLNYGENKILQSGEGEKLCHNSFNRDQDLISRTRFTKDVPKLRSSANHSLEAKADKQFVTEEQESECNKKSGKENKLSDQFYAEVISNQETSQAPAVKNNILVNIPETQKTKPVEPQEHVQTVHGRSGNPKMIKSTRATGIEAQETGSHVGTSMARSDESVGRDVIDKRKTTSATTENKSIDQEIISAKFSEKNFVKSQGRKCPSKSDKTCSKNRRETYEEANNRNQNRTCNGVSEKTREVCTGLTGTENNSSDKKQPGCESRAKVGDEHGNDDNPETNSHMRHAEKDDTSDINVVSREVIRARSDKESRGAERPVNATTDKRIGACAVQSSFALQIGNVCLKQSSLFAFALKGSQIRSSNKSGRKETTNVPQLHKMSESGKSVVTGERLGPEDQPETCPSDIQLKHKHETELGTEVVSTNTCSSIHKASKASSHSKNTNDVVSSSEEEAVLLRAQSLKLREKQSKALRVSKSSQLLGIGSSGTKVSSSSRNLGPSSASHLTTKSPVQNSKVQHKPDRKKDHASEPPRDVRSYNCQSVQPAILNQSGVLSDRSSIEGPVFISRNPHDWSEVSDNSLQLEIMSSSEDEHSSKRQKLHTETKNVGDRELRDPGYLKEEANAKQRTKGKNLSYKAKEIRRRREAKQNDLLRSSRLSSDSDPEDSQSPVVFSVQPPKLKTNIANNLKKRKEKFDRSRDGSYLSSLGNVKDGVSLKNSELDHKQLHDEAAAKNQSGQASGSGSSKDAGMGQQEIAQEFINQNEENATDIREKRAKRQGKRTRNLVVENEQIASGSGEVENLVTARILGKHDSKTEDDGDDNAQGPRISRRKRQAPGMFWLRQGHSDDVIGNRPMDKRATSRSSQFGVRKTKKPETDADDQKHGFEKKRRPGPKPSHRSKPVENVDLQSNSGEASAALFTEENRVLVGSDCRGVTCNALEVREMKCVRGYGMTADVLILGVGAKFHKQSPSQFSEVYHVLEGEISYHIAQENKTLNSGMFFIVPQGVTYHIKNIGCSTVKLSVVSHTA